MTTPAATQDDYTQQQQEQANEAAAALAAAIAVALTPAAVAALAKAWSEYRAMHPNHPASDAAYWLSRDRTLQQVLTEQIDPQLRKIWTDAYQAGQEFAGQSGTIPEDLLDDLSREWTQKIVQSRIMAIATALVDTDGDPAEAITKALSDPQYSSLIAHTETSRAGASGITDAYQEAGITRARWGLESPNPCPICIANADAGTTPLGQRYPSGDTAPPAHPNCWCIPLPG